VLTASAASPAALRAVAARLRGRVLDAGESELTDLCWTAAARRTHHPYRLAVLGSGSRELLERLDRAEKELAERPEVLEAAAGQERAQHSADAGVHFGVVPSDTADGAGPEAGDHRAGEAAARYVQGLPVDWNRLFPGPRRVVSLPGYPWQRTRHWIGQPAASPPAQPSVAAPGPEAVPPSHAGPGDAQPGTTALMRELLPLAPGPREQRLVDVLLAAVADVLGGNDGDVGPDQGFFDLGLDSVLSQELKARTERLLGRELPGTIMFECPTTRSLARFVREEVLTGPTQAAAPHGAPAADPVPEPVPGPASDADVSDDELLARLLDAVAGSQALLTEGE
jgi:acyl transferase domain-containing protein